MVGEQKVQSHTKPFICVMTKACKNNYNYNKSLQLMFKIIIIHNLGILFYSF